MAKLSFDWNARENCSEAFIGGFRIRAEQDSDARNPWDDMDGLAPLLVYSDRNLSEHGDFPNPLDSMSDSFIGKHWLALTKAFARPASDAAMHKRAYGGTIADARRELLSDWYHSDKPDKSGYGAEGERRNYLHPPDNITAASYRRLCRLLGVTRNG